MRENQFYCVKCRKPVTVNKSDIYLKVIRTSKRKRVPMIKSVCGKCDTNLTKFIKESDEKKWKKKW